VAQQPGARFAPAAFVTGTPDPAQASGFSNLVPAFTHASDVVIGEQTPPKSRAEMDVLG